MNFALRTRVCESGKTSGKVHARAYMMASELLPVELKQGSGPDGTILVIGICGASNGGKTTLAKNLLERHSSVTIIHQDEFYKEDDQVPLSKDGVEKLWDVVEAIKVDELVKAVKLAATSQLEALSKETEGVFLQALKHLVIVEGTLLLNMRELRPLLDAAYFITLDYDTMKMRRSAREYPGGFPDSPGYFDGYLWPSYMSDLKVACGAHHDGTVRMLDGTKDISENLEEIVLRMNKLVKKKQR